MENNVLEEIRQMYGDGFATKKIANKLSITDKLVVETIEQNHFILVKEDFTEDKIDHICELYKGGVSAKSLGIKFSINKQRVQKWAEQKGYLRTKAEARRVVAINEKIFDIIDSNEKAYWLGYLYSSSYNAEQSNTLVISTTEDNVKHLENLAIFFGLPINKIMNTEVNGYKYRMLKVYSKYLCERLVKIGCPRAKSFILTFPDWLSPIFHSHFIRGMFDGKGSLTKRESNNEWKLSLVSTKEICESIQNIVLKQINIIINFHSISKNDSNSFELEIQGNEKVRKILEYLYTDSKENIQLAIKYEKYLQLIKQQNNRAERYQDKE